MTYRCATESEQKRDPVSSSTVVFGAIVVLGTLALIALDPAVVLAQFKDDAFGQICDRSLKYLEGGFGSLLATVTGIGAIAASALGGFRMAWGLLIVSIGAFVLRNYLGVLGGDGGCG